MVGVVTAVSLVVSVFSMDYMPVDPHAPRFLDLTYETVWARLFAGSIPAARHDLILIVHTGDGLGLGLQLGLHGGVDLAIQDEKCPHQSEEANRFRQCKA